MIHTVAYELSASQAALTALTPVPDGTIAIQSTQIRVPAGMNQIVAAAAMINSATATLRAQIQAPSLRATLNYDIAPIVNGLVFGTIPRYLRLWNTPLQLQADEPVEVFVQNGAAVMNRAVLWLGDGSPKPTTGKIFSVRCTAAASLTTAVWVNSALTFQQTLPAGSYQVVGMRVFGANAVAARLFFVGGAWRPGVPCVNAEDNNDPWEFRLGNLGVFGEFKNTTPPSIDVLGVTDTAQVVILDLIKTA